MTLSKSARYALFAALEMGASLDEPVTVGDTADRHGIPPGALSKVFQQLVRSGIARGTRGVGGGYRLARPPTDITVLEVVSAFESPRASGEDVLGDTGADGGDGPARRIRALFEEVEEVTRSTLASVSLETLVRRDPAVPAGRPQRRAARAAR